MSVLEQPMPAALANGRRASGGAARGGSRHDRLQLALGIVALVAAAALVILGAMNRSLQAEVAAGQARIANAQAAANVNNTLIRLLAKAAAERSDERIRALLARNGISYRPASAAGANPAPSPNNGK